MRTTILTCDRCKKEVDVLIEVGAGIRHCSSSRYSTLVGYDIYQLQAEWCLNCCFEMSITQPSQDSPQPIIEPQPTLEDFIREIIREEVAANSR